MYKGNYTGINSASDISKAKKQFYSFNKFNFFNLTSEEILEIKRVADLYQSNFPNIDDGLYDGYQRYYQVLQFLNKQGFSVLKFSSFQQRSAFLISMIDPNLEQYLYYRELHNQRLSQPSLDIAAEMRQKFGWVDKNFLVLEQIYYRTYNQNLKKPVYLKRVLK